MADTGTTGLRQRLRSETRALHATLDAVMAEFDPFVSAPRYAAYLRGMGELYATYGASLDWASGQAGLEQRSQRLLGQLHADLASTGAAPADPAPPPVGRLPAPGAAWGEAYVLEGAAMGARSLVKQVQQRLPGVATGFLQELAHGGTTRWPTFADALDQTQGADPQAVEAAEGVFRHACRIFGEGKPTDT